MTGAQRVQYALDLGDSVVVFELETDPAGLLMPVVPTLDSDSKEGKDTNEAITRYTRGHRDETTMRILRENATPKYPVKHPGYPYGDPFGGTMG